MSRFSSPVYPIYPGNPPRPSSFIWDIGTKVKEVEWQYNAILLLGGWDYKGVDPAFTLAEAEKRVFEKLWVPVDKIYDRARLGCGEYMPPRDTMEEVDLCPRMLKALTDLPPRKVEFDVIGIWSWMIRIGFLYRQRGARIKRFIWTSSWLGLWPKYSVLYQFGGLVNNILDPLGKSQRTARLREIRTLDDPKKYSLNLPIAWEG